MRDVVLIATAAVFQPRSPVGFAWCTPVHADHVVIVTTTILAWYATLSRCL
jgi:hypothetical protein